MKTIDYNDLIIIDNDCYNSGSFGIIRRCIYNNKEYALKEFKQKFYLAGKKRKLSSLSDINQKGLLTPKFWVKKDNNTNRYLSDWCDGKNIEAYSDYETQEKINILKKAKEQILIMHDEKIIHSDLIGSNIMVSSNQDTNIIDFDNSTFDNYKTIPRDTNDLSIEFIKRYGIKKEIDVFLFNVLTFYIINDCSPHLVRRNILADNLKYFDNPESKKVCKTLLLEHKTPSKDFLIDTIDETSFTR